MNNVDILLIALLATSEALALIPQVRANSVFQLLIGIVGRLKK